MTSYKIEDNEADITLEIGKGKGKSVYINIRRIIAGKIMQAECFINRNILFDILEREDIHTDLPKDKHMFCVQKSEKDLNDDELDAGIIGPGWYFWDETLAIAHGSFNTYAECESMLQEYKDSLNDNHSLSTEGMEEQK